MKMKFINYPQSDTIFSNNYPQSVTYRDIFILPFYLVHRIERELDKIM
jgi:hypothetical protein